MKKCHPEPQSVSPARFPAIAIPLFLVIAAFSACQRAAPEPPVAFLVATAEPFVVKTGWFRSTTVSSALTLYARDRITLPAGAHAQLVQHDGSQSTVVAPGRFHGASITSVVPAAYRWLSESIATAPVSSSTHLIITSPVGATRWREPVFLWTAQPGRTYDVALFDPADPEWPPRIARAVRPPLALAQLGRISTTPLRTDRIYEVYIRDSGNAQVTAARQFLIAPNATLDAPPSDPAAQTLLALEALLARPAHTGDAWRMLQELPETWTTSDFVTRLRWRAVQEIGFVSPKS